MGEVLISENELLIIIEKRAGNGKWISKIMILRFIDACLISDFLTSSLDLSVFECPFIKFVTDNFTTLKPEPSKKLIYKRYQWRNPRKYPERLFLF